LGSSQYSFRDRMPRDMGPIPSRPSTDHEGMLVSDARYETYDAGRIRIPDTPRGGNPML